MKKEHELFVPLAHQLELGMMFGASRFAGDVPATVVTLFVVLVSTTTRWDEWGCAASSPNFFMRDLLNCFCDGDLGDNVHYTYLVLL